MLAVRDLCAEQTLVWHTDERGRYVELSLPKGVGTMLALLETPQNAPLELRVSHPVVAGGESLTVQVVRNGADGRPIRTSHTFRVGITDARGQALAGLRRLPPARVRCCSPCPWPSPIPKAPGRSRRKI